MEMPRKGGVETVQWLRAQEASDARPRCRVIMMSGNDDEASAARALAAGADRFLVKPVRPDRLLATIAELEAGHAAADSAGARPPGSGNGATQPGEVVVVDAEWREVFPDFLRMQRETAEAMARALAAGAREDLQFLAHRAYGGLSAMGMDWAARQSRLLEQDALQGSTRELESRIEALREHLTRVRLA
jgi:DNA-binding response OmpR family regulator